MSYYAQLDGNNRVLNVIVADSLEWVEANLGGWWIETSKDPADSNCAVINAVWDARNEAFIWPQSYPSWVLNKSFRWVAPIDYPEDGGEYVWDEETGDWLEVVE